MSTSLQQLTVRGQQLLAESEDGIEDETLQALISWLAELQQVLPHPQGEHHSREALEQILAVNEAITEVVRKNREELGASIRQTRTGIDAVKAYQGKS